MLMKKQNPERPQSRRDRLKSYNDLDLYGQSKQALIKKIQILIHELKVYARMEEDLEEEYKNFEKRGFVQMQITIQSYQHNQEVLSQKVSSLEKNQIDMEKIVQEKEKSIEKLQKQVQIYKKKAENLQRVGGKFKIQKLEEEKFKITKEIQQLRVENIILKKQVQEKSVKCKILQDLNRQTESKVVETLIRMKNQEQANDLPLPQQFAEKENNMNEGNTFHENSAKIQLFSLKEQLRQLREQLKASQQAKQHLKLKMQQRQLFYSKMLASKN